ncbi:MAG: sigma-70 family RNA polymerase sigma factor [Planctomycetota bacterium]
MTIDNDRLFEHAELIRRLSRSLARDDHGADDLAQDAFVVALLQPASKTRRLQGWLSAVVRNLALKQWRGEVRRARRERWAARAELVPSTEDIHARSELQRQIAEAVAGLPEPYRSTVWLRYFEELSTADIALRDGITESSVRSRLSRAMDYLRTKLDALDPSCKSLLIALAGPPTGPFRKPTPRALEPANVAFGLQVAAVLTVVALPTFWFARSTLLAQPVPSRELASSETEEPGGVPLLETLPPSNDSAEEAPPKGPKPPPVIQEEMPSVAVAPLVQPGKRPLQERSQDPNEPTWDLAEQEKDSAKKARSQDGLAKLIRRYYELKDESEYSSMEKALKQIREELDGWAKKQRWDTSEHTAESRALAHTELLVEPMSEFPNYPRQQTGRVLELESENAARCWYSVPKGYRNREGFWPTVLILLDAGPEDEQPWFEEFHRSHSDLSARAILIVPKRPRDESWEADQGVANCLAPLGTLSWDRVRVDQDRIHLLGIGAASADAVRLAARFSDRFAGLAIEEDVEPEDQHLNALPLAALAPRGRFTAAQIERGPSRIAFVEDWPRDLARWAEAARRIRIPERVTRIVPDFKHSDAVWLKVRELSRAPDEEKPARVDARLDRESNAIHVTSEGVARFYFRLNDEVLDLDRPVVVFVNEKKLYDQRVERGADEMLDTAYLTGERSRLWTRIIEVSMQ